MKMELNISPAPERIFCLDFFFCLEVCYNPCQWLHLNGSLCYQEHPRIFIIWHGILPEDVMSLCVIVQTYFLIVWVTFALKWAESLTRSD